MSRGRPGGGPAPFERVAVRRCSSAAFLLFLVDRSNLGEQAQKDFEGYRTPDDNRKFTELYNENWMAVDLLAVMDGDANRS